MHRRPWRHPAGLHRLELLVERQREHVPELDSDFELVYLYTQPQPQHGRQSEMLVE